MGHSYQAAAPSRIVAVANSKGGVGKTEITAQVGGLLAAADYRVCLLDLDPQGDLGVNLGYRAAGLADDGASLAKTVQYDDNPFEPLRDVRPGLDVVSGGERLEDLTAVAGRSGHSRELAQGAFSRRVRQLAEGYDFVLVDCPPGNEVLQEMVLGAVRFVVIPTKTDDASRTGLGRVAARFVEARAVNPELRLLGVVLFGVGSNAKRVLARARESLEADLGGAAPVLETTIRHVEATAVAIRERGQLVHELERDAAVETRRRLEWLRARKRGGRHGHADGSQLGGTASQLAGDYQALAEELLTRIETVEGIAA